jgi:hypothetical protein
MVAHAVSVLDSYVDGFALQEASLPLSASAGPEAAPAESPARQQMIPEAFPHLADMVATHILTPGYAYGDEFDFGLRLILDGLEAAQEAGAAG